METRILVPLDGSSPLLCGQAYYFWLEIGAPLAGSIEEKPTPLPTDHLPRQALLKVVLHTLDDGLVLTAGASIGELEIQYGGSVKPGNAAEISAVSNVDGGLVGNLPIEIMQQMNVDVIIAVDVEFPLYGPEDLDSLLKISEQMLTILMRNEKLRQIGRLGDRDVLIQPELGIFASTNFADILDTIEPGATAAREQAGALAALWKLDAPTPRAPLA